MNSPPPEPSLRSLRPRNAAKTLSLAAFVCLAATLHGQTVVSLNKPVTASGYYTDGGNLASFAVDGDTATYWNSGGYSGWLKIDLGAMYSLYQITLLGYVNLGPDSGRTNVYTLSRSDDGSTWTTVGSGTFVENSHPSDTWNLNGAAGRYIKYEVLPESTNWAALPEITVTAIPEPSTFAAAIGLGALGFAACRRRQRNSS